VSRGRRGGSVNIFAEQDVMRGVICLNFVR
jgi:hypothetical protein